MALNSVQWMPHASLSVPYSVPVMLLLGQSNMVGHGPLRDAGAASWSGGLSLESMRQDGRVPEALCRPHPQIWMCFARAQPRKPSGFLEPGFGVSSDFFGPELGLGESLGQAWSAPMALFKSARGRTSLAQDWRSPTAVARAGGEVGRLYQRTVDGITSFLEGPVQHAFPKLPASTRFECSGLVWLQGQSDMQDPSYREGYEENLYDLMCDLRAALVRPSLPVVLVQGPVAHMALDRARHRALVRLEEIAPGRQAFVPTADLADSSIEGSFHFHYNAHAYLEVGRRIGRALLPLVTPS